MINVVWFVITLPFMIPALLITPLFLIECILQWLFCLPALVWRFLGWADVTIRWNWHGRVDDERVRGWRRAKDVLHQLKSAPPQPFVAPAPSFANTPGPARETLGARFNG